MILEEFAFLASDTTRSKAYLQAMIQEEKIPKLCVVYSDQIIKMQEEAKQYKEAGENKMYFDADMPLLFSLQRANIPYLLVEEKDINTEQIRSVIQKLEQKYLIYSGYGGYILKPHLFQMGKKFIHIHAGLLPQYRGSTTIYYSFLQERIFGATAIFLSEGLDEGEILAQGTFEMPKEAVNMDYIYEPFIRSKVLIQVLQQYIEKGYLAGEKQGCQGAETYYIIHPVLKHLALLGMENRNEQEAGMWR